jgi:signal transduction histidine kinase
LSPQKTQPFSHFTADQVQARCNEIVAQWVDVLSSRLGIRPRRVLPTESLLDHVPQVIEKISMHLREGTEPIEVKEVVTSELAALARLRRKQGYDIGEILREFEILGRILDDVVTECVGLYPGDAPPRDVALTAGWLHRSLQVMGTVTAAIYREEELKDRLEAARILRDFADTLMHQLKSPLGAAEGAALLLLNDEISAEPQERIRFAAIVERNLKRARAVIDDVRALALAESSFAGIGRSEPMAEVVQAAMEEVKPLADRIGVGMEVRGEVPDVMVDASRVEVILLNLLGNAVKYADPEKPRRWVRVTVGPLQGDDVRWVSVEDNGLGIPPEQHERVFQRFFRAHPAAAEGTGLGLSIVREAAEQIGGRVEFDSAPGEGSVFRFSVPRPEEEVRDTVTEGDEGSSSSSGGRGKKRADERLRGPGD